MRHEPCSGSVNGIWNSNAESRLNTAREVAPMVGSRRWSFAALVFVIVPAGLSRAAEPDGEKWLVDRALTVSAAAPTPPVLKYKLFPLASELRDGNAVPIYLRLVHGQTDAARKRWVELPKQWNELPIDRVPLVQAKEFLYSPSDGMNYQLEQLDWGARSKFADWNYTIRPGQVIELLLPDVSEMRGYVPMMVLRARVHLAESNFAAAARSIETGFAFSRHVAEAP